MCCHVPRKNLFVADEGDSTEKKIYNYKKKSGRNSVYSSVDFNPHGNH